MVAAAVLALVLAGAAAARTHLWDTRRADDVGPYAWGVHVSPDGQRAVVPPGTHATYLPDSRVFAPGPQDSAAHANAARAQAALAQDWLDEAQMPGTGSPFEDMTRAALLDIHALSFDGAALAGYNPNWRYVWPRDASFIAAALATVGQVDDAVAILTFLQDVQHPDGTFEARYLPDGSGPPDERGIQIDGTGWVLWAADHVLGTLEPGDLRIQQIRADLHGLLERSTAQLLHQVDTPDSLPPPSADYWEHRESDLTLGTAAPVLAGLRSAHRIWSDDGDAARATQTHQAAERLEQAIKTEFGPAYARYADSTQRDAATAFLLPPFQPAALSGGMDAWRTSIEPMRRPAGGLAPGASWREQTLSWTPQTSLYALAAAHNGEPGMALDWLTWLDAHRTPLGAIPEKVSADGSPAAVAPLAWSAAVVVLTVAQLEADGALPPAGP